jgi:hypothetical protein
MMLKKLETHLIMQECSWVIVICAKFSIVGDENLNEPCFDSQLLLQLSFPLNVVVPKIEYADEDENYDFGALESFMTAPKPFPGE